MNPNRLLAVLGLTGFASNIAIRIVDPIIPVLAREFNVTVAVAALLASAYTLPYALGQPILGPLGDAKGKARVMAIALLVLAAGLAGSMCAWSITSMAVFRAISGLAAGATIPLGIAMIGDRFPMEERQVVLSRYLLAIIVGQLSGAPLAGMMADTIGWRPVFGIAAFFSLIAGIAVGVMIKPQSGAVRSSFNLAAIKANYRLVLSRPLAKYCYGAVFAEGVLIYGFLPYVADLLEQRGSGGVREAGFVVAGIGVGGLLFNLVLPSLLRRTSRPTVMALGGCVILAGMTGVAIGSTWQAEMAAFTIVGLGFYMLHTGIQVEVTEFAPDARGSAIALHAFCLFLGMAIGPVVYGQAIPLLGAPVSLVLGGIGVLAAALLLAGKVQRPR